jgi:hypothetical protein
MFPPALESLSLPCPVVRDGRAVSVASIDSPLDVSLFPASLRSLHMADKQSLCCTDDTAAVLQKLCIASLEVAVVSLESRSSLVGYGRTYYTPISHLDEARFHGVGNCRAQLQRRITLAQDAYQNSEAHGEEPKAAAALPFTMGTSKRG